MPHEAPKENEALRTPSDKPKLDRRSFLLGGYIAGTTVGVAAAGTAIALNMAISIREEQKLYGDLSAQEAKLLKKREFVLTMLKAHAPEGDTPNPSAFAAYTEQKDDLEERITDHNKKVTELNARKTQPQLKLIPSFDDVLNPGAERQKLGELLELKHPAKKKDDAE